MIDYGFFRYSGAPRTGTTWFIHAMHAGGLGPGNKTQVHIPFNNGDDNKLCVSTVRHPCDWLASYFTTIHRATLAIPCVDVFNILPVDYFDNFIRKYLRRMPGAVGRMLEGYDAHSMLRVEDYPWNAVELLEACGVPKRERESCVPIKKINFATKELPKWNPALFDRVEEAEKHMMDLYSY